LPSSAQNWQFFPLDSMRGLTDSSALSIGGHLRGMDYRTHEKIGSKTIIHLDSFSNYRRLAPSKDGNSKYYITGNSFLGNSIEVTNQTTKLYFLKDGNKSLLSDSFILLNDNTLGIRWKFIENSKILAFATNSSLTYDNTPNGMDSIKTISIWVTLKSDPNDSLEYILRVGKRFGILNPLLLDPFRTFVHTIKYTYTFLPYIEYTEKDFFKIEPYTEVHTRRVIDDAPILLDLDVKEIRKDIKTEYYEQNNKLLFNQTTFTKYITSIGPYGEDFYSDALIEKALDYTQKRVGSHTINPIPTPKDYFNNYRVEFSCDYTHYSYILLKLAVNEVTISADTLTHKTSYVNKDGALHFTETKFEQGIGIINTDTFYDYENHRLSISSSTKIEYFKKEECEMGTKSTFVSVSPTIFSSLKTYPNPASHSLRIDHKLSSSFKAQLIDLLGKTYNTKIENGKINVEDLQDGIYILKLSQGSDIFTKRIIVQH
jgi:hypothetical protein